ncbi:MAG TPA: polysaccharide biosynthesis/export family protein [Vicinamibacterales bacterium]|nr:polysaccharide biosynthesis/export family protein [Vicinamibacterales bacterium]
MRPALPILTIALLATAAAPAFAGQQATSTAGRTPAPAPAATAGSTAGVALPSDYRLAVGDKLRIEVYKDAQLSQSVQVRPDGKITLPLLGDMQAAGLTPLGLRDELTKSLKEYMTAPNVTVMVVEATPATVFVMGEVNQPGAQPIRGSMTVLEALSMAGGFKDFAKTSDIRILRKGPNGNETLRFNYKKALKGEAEPIALRAGDVVVVP